MSQQFHLTDEEILMELDGELTPRESERVRSHMAFCWECRTRKRDAEAAIAEFMHFRQSNTPDQVSSSEGPRALLRARINELSAPKRHGRQVFHFFEPRWTLVLLFLVIVGISVGIARVISQQVRADDLAVTIPDPHLTPGATVLLSRAEVCQAAGEKNKMVSAAIQKKVFAEYGIRGANPNAYEVDYLITPALGGADDIHNLWPESNSAAVWNSQVKDALEDRLRDLVCAGQLDLQTAQREIAGNWILAYKKYFHTEMPLGNIR